MCSIVFEAHSLARRLYHYAYAQYDKENEEGCGRDGVADLCEGFRLKCLWTLRLTGLLVLGEELSLRDLMR